MTPVRYIPVAFFNLTEDDLSDANLEATAQRVFDAMSERRRVEGPDSQPTDAEK